MLGITCFEHIKQMCVLSRSPFNYFWLPSGFIPWKEKHPLLQGAEDGGKNKEANAGV